MQIGGYFLPRRFLLAALAGVLLLAALAYLLFFRGSGSQSSTPLIGGKKVQVTTVKAPAVTVPSSGLPSIERSVASGRVLRRSCSGQGKRLHCREQPLVGAKVLFLTLRPPNQGRRFTATTDRGGRFSIRLRVNSYSARVLGYRSQVTSVLLVAQRPLAMPSLIVTSKLQQPEAKTAAHKKTKG